MKSTDSRLGPRIRGVMVAASCNGELRFAASIRHCQDGNPGRGEGTRPGRRSCAYMTYQSRKSSRFT